MNKNPSNETGSGRVIRGGSWVSYASYLRCAIRYRRSPDFRSSTLGVRLLRTKIDQNKIEKEIKMNDREMDTLYEEFKGKLLAEGFIHKAGYGLTSDHTATKKDNFFNEEDFVTIKAGQFLMGDKSTGVYHVELTEDFQMCDHPVTEKEWCEFLGERYEGGNANKPKVNISWNEAKEFIEKLNKSQDKYTYALPTEAQWEYAARAGTNYRFFHGDDEERLGDYAWYEENCNKLQEVKKKLPNEWGLYDMLGNVWEWVEDAYRPYSQYMRSCEGEENDEKKS